MCHNYEDFGMIHHLADYIEENKIQLFVVDTVDRESWSPKGGDNEFRAARQEQYASGETDGRGLRDAVDACLWKKMNRSLIRFAEEKTLSEFVQECRNHLSGEWDLYVI